MTEADDEGVTGLSPSGRQIRWSHTHPWYLRATGAKLELTMKKFIHDNIPDGGVEHEQFRRQIKENMKPAFWVVLPTNERFDVMAFRQCGANRDFYEFVQENRTEFVGGYVGQHCRFDPTSELENKTRGAIAEIDPESEIQVGTCVGKNCVFAAYSAPLNVDGKVCLVGCAITFQERNVSGWDAGDNMRELTLALRALDFFKREVCMTMDTMRYTQANLREYMLVDYPRKFIWHDSLFTVKNTFLNVNSSYASHHPSSTKAFNPHSSRSDLDMTPSKLMYDASRDNLRLFERICKDIGIIFGDRELSGPVEEERTGVRKGAYVAPWTVDRWNAGGAASSRSSSTTNSNPRTQDPARGYWDELPSSSSPDTTYENATGGSNLVQRWTRIKIEEDEACESRAVTDDECDGGSENLDFIVPRSRSAPTVGGANEEPVIRFLPLYLRNPSPASYGGNAPGASPPCSGPPKKEAVQTRERERSKAPSYGGNAPGASPPCSAPKKEAVQKRELRSIPPHRLLRNPGAHAVSGSSSSNDNGGVDTSGAEGSGSKVLVSDYSTRDSTSSSPMNDVTPTPPLKQARKLKVGDRVELHSFPYATWLWGLRGRVKHVLVDKRRKNRERRITIEYDNPEYQEQTTYLKTIPVSNARLIRKDEK